MADPKEVWVIVERISGRPIDVTRHQEDFDPPDRLHSVTRYVLPEPVIPTASPWVSTEERMPEPMAWVLIHEDGATCVAHWGGGSVWWPDVIGAGAFPVGEVTHWMPLPAPPPQPGPRTLAEVQAEFDAINAAEQRGRERRLELKREIEKIKEVESGETGNP